MEITKNDIVKIRYFTAILEEKKRRAFTHELRVTFNALSMNAANYEINELIESHFDLIDNDSVVTDVYKLTNGGVDSEGESGWSNEGIIKEIEFYKAEMVDNETVTAVYLLTLSNITSFTL